MADDLSAPLLRRSDRRKAALRGLGSRTGISRLPLARLALAGIVVVLGAAGLRVMLTDDPLGGRPSAEVPINSTRDGNSVAGAIAPNTDSQPKGPVTLGADPETPGPAITTLEDTPAAEPAAGVSAAGGPLPGLDGDLIEETEDGPIPRIAANGTTPFEAYARADLAAVAGRPMIALIVTGMGLNEARTLEAIDALPAAITLGFAPYGRTLDATVPAARAAGHELLLEVPLEPFDYPNNDPGPHTLLTGQAPRDNIDKLIWLMARFGGYVGLINNMGARFTASAADFAPFMEELGARGLGYVDDGTSNRSLAAQLTAANHVPFARAMMTIDANPAPGPIRAALDALEQKAVSTGAAIGLATALPVSIATLAEWASGLEDRGIALVPVSALMKTGG